MSASGRKLCDQAHTLSKRIHELCGHKMRDNQLLMSMSQHTSVLKSKRRYAEFQKLEFLGDKVLAICVANILYRICDDEGQMSRRLARITGTESLRETAGEVLPGCFMIAPSASGSSALADMLEAVIAGIYLEAGLDCAELFVSKIFANVFEAPDNKDCKSLLQEYSQSQRGGLPVYETLERTGPDHEPVFHVRVTCLGRETDGFGASIKRAEHQAARSMLEICGIHV